MVAILLNSFLDRFGFWGGRAKFKCFCCLVVLGANEDASGFWDVHVEGELKIDFITLFIDFKEKIGSRGRLFLFFLCFLDHFLSKLVFLKFKNIIYRLNQYFTTPLSPPQTH